MKEIIFPIYSNGTIYDGPMQNLNMYLNKDHHTIMDYLREQHSVNSLERIIFDICEKKGDPIDRVIVPWKDWATNICLNPHKIFHVLKYTKGERR